MNNDLYNELVIVSPDDASCDRHSGLTMIDVMRFNVTITTRTLLTLRSSRFSFGEFVN